MQVGLSAVVHLILVAGAMLHVFGSVLLLVVDGLQLQVEVEGSHLGCAV